MNWGKGITLAFILFALFIGGLVAICVRQQIGLVSKDYYSQELKYQEQIDQIANASALADKPTVVAGNGVVELRYSHLDAIESGNLHLVRPSDAAFDRSFKVVTTPDSVAQFDVTALPAGKYIVSFTWRMEEKDFLLQEAIVL